MNLGEVWKPLNSAKSGTFTKILNLALTGKRDRGCGSS
jgi:hypothetical protein